MYDYYLGGKNHFAADRKVAEKLLASVPSGRTGARENRAFLGRAVRYLTAEAGVRQFLDIGTGLPTTNNVHEVAQAAAPAARVVYVDNDPLVLAHARALLTSSPEGRTAYVKADLRHPLSILSSPLVHEVLDFGEPIALMLVAVLHFLRDEDKPDEVVGTLLDALAPDSYLAASHLTMEHDPGRWAAVSRFTWTRGSRCTPGTPISSPGWRSPAWRWCRPAWCSSRSGGRTATRQVRPPPKSGATAARPVSGEG
jgi:hypothetical protein